MQVVNPQLAHLYSKESKGHMGISVQARESYQPHVDQHGRFVGGERDYRARLRLIEQEVDFTGATVLDLGCSGGFFSFGAARKAKSVTAIDADAHMIERNRKAAGQLHCTNVEFVCERITPELLDNLPKFDVVLFLSVFHHMLTDSGSYDWGNAKDPNEPGRLLAAIRRRSSTLVFEMGRPDEHVGWSQRVRSAIGEPRDWVPRHVFGRDAADVKTLAGCGYRRFPFRWFPQLASPCSHTRVGRKFMYILGINPCDFREIYVGHPVADGRP